MMLNMETGNSNKNMARETIAKVLRLGQITKIRPNYRVFNKYNFEAIYYLFTKHALYYAARK